MNWKNGEKRKRGIKTIQIPLSIEDYNRIIRAKGTKTWPQFLLKKSEE